MRRRALGIALVLHKVGDFEREKEFLADIENMPERAAMLDSLGAPPPNLSTLQDHANSEMEKARVEMEAMGMIPEAELLAFERELDDYEDAYYRSIGEEPPQRDRTAS